MSNGLKIYLVDSGEQLCKSWRQHLKSFDLSYQSWGIDPVSISSYPSTPITSLKTTDFPNSNDTYTVSAVVSPGNSLGEMNGGLDKVLKDSFISSGVEQSLKSHFPSGYSPPGSVNLVHLPGNHKAKEMWNAEYLVHLPTMRVPRPVHISDLESLRMVFDWTWNILSEVDNHNHKTGPLPKIGSLILTGLATGYGKIPPEIAGKAMIAAIIIFNRREFSSQERRYYTLKFLQEDTLWFSVPSSIPQEVITLEFDPLIDGLPKLFMYTPLSQRGFASLSFHA